MTKLSKNLLHSLGIMTEVEAAVYFAALELGRAQYERWR